MKQLKQRSLLVMLLLPVIAGIGLTSCSGDYLEGFQEEGTQRYSISVSDGDGGTSIPRTVTIHVDPDADGAQALFGNETVNTYLKESDLPDPAVLEAAETFFRKLDSVMGILPPEASGEEGESAGIEKLIAERNEARKRKDFSRSDEIRDELAARGIVLEDTPDGTKWKKKG